MLNSSQCLNRKCFKMLKMLQIHKQLFEKAMNVSFHSWLLMIIRQFGNLALCIDCIFCETLITYSIYSLHNMDYGLGIICGYIKESKK